MSEPELGRVAIERAAHALFVDQYGAAAHWHMQPAGIVPKPEPDVGRRKLQSELARKGEQ